MSATHPSYQEAGPGLCVEGRGRQEGGGGAAPLSVPSGVGRTSGRLPAQRSTRRTAPAPTPSSPGASAGREDPSPRGPPPASPRPAAPAPRSRAPARTARRATRSARVPPGRPRAHARSRPRTAPAPRAGPVVGAPRAPPAPPAPPPPRPSAPRGPRKEKGREGPARENPERKAGKVTHLQLGIYLAQTEEGSPPTRRLRGERGEKVPLCFVLFDFQ